MFAFPIEECDYLVECCSPQYEDDDFVRKPVENAIPTELVSYTKAVSSVVCAEKYKTMCYSIKLDVMSEAGLGLSFSEMLGRLVVSRIMPGQVSKWNAVHKDAHRQVQVGDEIRSVDGVKHNMRKRLSEMGQTVAKLDKPIRITIHLSRDGHDKLGFHVVNGFIVDIMPDGLLDKWLCANPTVPLCLGDYITDVNGRMGWPEIDTELKCANSLVMIVAHYESPCDYRQM